MDEIKLKFKEWDCILKSSYYMNGRKALTLVEDDIMASPIATCTTNLVDDLCPDDCAYIKDYSENEGMVDILIDEGIIYPGPVDVVKSGFVVIGLYTLTEKTLKLFDES